MDHRDLDFFRARAVQCREEYRHATLQNVRDRCERAEAAWNDLIERAERHELEKQVSAARKAEAGEAAAMLRHRAEECLHLAERARTEVAKESFQLLARQLEEQARQMVPDAHP